MSRFAVTSWNVNGLRAVNTKGFPEWLAGSKSNVVFLQETKALPEQLPDGLLEPRGWRASFHSAERKGYSGVAAYMRDEPDEIIHGLGVKKYDVEGRAIQLRYGDLWVIGAYFPNGGNELARVPYKLGFYRSMLTRMKKLRDAGQRVLVTGDYNTSHQEIDLARPKANVKNTGFLPEERAWMDKYVKAGFVDTFRHLHPTQTGAYSWWSYRGGARERNVGWRLDYHFVDEALAENLTAATIEADVLGSDHCPVSAVLKL